MKRLMTILLAVCFIASGLLNAHADEIQAKEVYITIGGGDFTGVYFPTGLAIAKMINERRPAYHIRATVESTPGSVFNLNAIMAGFMEFGLTQADKQYQAVNGLDEWAKKGPQKELRSVFSIYHEPLTLVAAVDAGIKSIADLRGKRVSLGNPGHSQRRIVVDALETTGLDPKRDFLPLTVPADDAPALLEDDRIDAYFFAVGHPSETIRKALSGKRKTRIIPISGPGIDKLVADKSFYTKSRIQVRQLYPGLKEPQEDVDTFGVNATLCTSISVPEEVVYSLMSVVFENFDEFRRQHPALAYLTKEGRLKGLSAPFHPGAQKYFREVGLMK